MLFKALLGLLQLLHFFLIHTDIGDNGRTIIMTNVVQRRRSEVGVLDVNDNVDVAVSVGLFLVAVGGIAVTDNDGHFGRGISSTGRTVHTALAVPVPWT